MGKAPNVGNEFEHSYHVVKFTVSDQQQHEPFYRVFPMINQLPWLLSTKAVGIPLDALLNIVTSDPAPTLVPR